MRVETYTGKTKVTQFSAEEWDAMRPKIDWQPMETAPRDGSRFLAWCGETGDQGVDMARWYGKSPSDPIGYFKTRYGWIPMWWAPMPETPPAPPVRPRHFPNPA